MLELLLFLLVVGVALYLFNSYITRIDPKIKEIINVIVVVLALVVVCLFFFGKQPFHWPR